MTPCSRGGKGVGRILIPRRIRLGTSENGLREQLGRAGGPRMGRGRSTYIRLLNYYSLGGPSMASFGRFVFRTGQAARPSSTAIRATTPSARVLSSSAARMSSAISKRRPSLTRTRLGQAR